VKEQLVNKSERYSFHRPRARSARMMGTCGQMAVLGINLSKLVRQLAGRCDTLLVG
jgi:transposase